MNTAQKAIILIVAALILIGIFRPTSPSHKAGAAVSLPRTTVAPVTLRYRVSAYCPCKLCCSAKWADGFTASGRPAKGLICAAPPEIPFGTVIDVPGYGRAVVADRGGAIKGNRLDVLFTDKDGVSGHQRALNWGVQYLDVTIYAGAAEKHLTSPSTGE